MDQQQAPSQPHQGSRPVNASHQQRPSKMNEILYGKNKFAQTMDQFEAKTGCKREYVFYAILSVPALIVALLLGGDLIIIGFAFVYPGLKTAEAVEKNDAKEMQRWLAYWVVICVSFCAAWIIDTFLFWFPGLFWMKLGYILWLLAPEPYSGTMMIYGGFVGPKVRQLLPQIKQQLESVYNTGRNFTSPRGSGGSVDHRPVSGGSHSALPRGSQPTGANQGSQMRPSGGSGGGGAPRTQQPVPASRGSQEHEDYEEEDDE
ncbi:receptor expression-enhancing protein 5-like [Convolutriloba macropyga]|uniref:receptor expression-enhancing protein 5-like n=1 Tax=Convolutriloba macropyga TaxID=536237 RepID=UPI003F51D188